MTLSSPMNMYGNGANQQYGQNMYGNGANQQYGQNMYGNGANQQYGQNMYGNGKYPGTPWGTGDTAGDRIFRQTAGAGISDASIIEQ